MIVIDTDMPESCSKCAFNHDSCWCSITKSEIDRDDESSERLKDCPITECKNNYAGSVHLQDKAVVLKYPVITKAKALAAQRVLYDNGIHPDETGVVLQAIGYVLLETELEEIIEWNEDYLPYKDSIWEEIKEDKENG